MSKRYSKKKRLTKKEFIRRKRIKKMIRCGVVIMIVFTIFCLNSTAFLNLLGINKIKQVAPVDIKESFLTPNKYSRPQDKLKKVKGIVIHYTANPGTSAKGNRDYFNGLARSHITYASSHFVIGMKGEIIQCIPLNEIAYASNKRNYDTISIECCHPDASGKFTDETYDSLIKLVAWLSGKYNITKNNIIRHYDVTGKCCPKYYVDHSDAWLKLKDDVFKHISAYGK